MSRGVPIHLQPRDRSFWIGCGPVRQFRPLVNETSDGGGMWALRQWLNRACVAFHHARYYKKFLGFVAHADRKLAQTFR